MPSNKNKRYMAVGTLILLQTFNLYFSKPEQKRSVENNMEEKEKEKEDDDVSELFLSKNIENTEKNINTILSHFSSSSYNSSSNHSSINELTEEDISEIISIVDKSDKLDTTTKKIIKVNSALLLLMQRRRISRS